jgi:ABC-type multidrug transport system ATPase subunit
MALLEADCIGKAYGARRVLTSASLRAPEGAVTALIGRNGSGKSTLLAVAAGWRQADTGTVRFDAVSYLRPHLVTLSAQGLFYLPDREILSPGIPLHRQLESVARRYGTSAVVTPVAEELDLVHCLLSDEPFRGMSPLDAERLTRVFRRLAAGGCAVVISGHEIDTLLDAADRVVWCTDGTTYEYSSPADVQADWRFQQGYLGRQ